jgi:hypothetical protein
VHDVPSSGPREPISQRAGPSSHRVTLLKALSDDSTENPSTGEPVTAAPAAGSGTASNPGTATIRSPGPDGWV